MIAAIAKNNAIGKDNNLLWDIPDDMKRFMRITSGHKVVMGRGTADSMNGKPLKNRENIVITRQKDLELPGFIVVHSVEDAWELCDPNDENFIIGGGAIYKAFLPYANRLYLTHVDKSFEADAFFPEVDYSLWKLTSKTSMPYMNDQGFSYEYRDYARLAK